MAGELFYVDVDVNGNEIQNFSVQRLSAAPASPLTGRMYYNTTNNKLYYYNGTTWIAGTAITAQNKNDDGQVTGSYGPVENVSTDTWIFRNIKGKTSKIIVTLNAGTIEIDAAITKSDVGLSNVTNDAQVKRSEMGAVNGVATLGADGKVPAVQLPSYVDDIVEFERSFTPPASGMTIGKLYYDLTNKNFLEATSPTAGNIIAPETGKIYVNIDTAKTYRWSGTDLIVISETLALGETQFSAYRGDRGKEAYDHSQTAVGMTTPHVSDTERSTWNNKQEKTINITAPTASDTQATAGDHTIRNLSQKLVDNISALFDRFSSSTGHDHDGTDSKKIDYANLTGTGAIVKRHTVSGLTGLTGTITAATHGCGTKPQVQFMAGGKIVRVAITIGGTGDVTWASNKSFVAGDTAEIVIQGI